MAVATAAATSTPLDQLIKMTNLVEVDVKLGKLIKPGMTVVIMRDLGGHRIPLGTVCEILKVNRPTRYLDEINYNVKGISPGSIISNALIRRGEFRLLGVQREVIEDIIKSLDQERATYQALITVMDNLDLKKATDFIDVRKEMIKKVYGILQTNPETPESEKLDAIINLVDTLSMI